MHAAVRSFRDCGYQEFLCASARTSWAASTILRCSLRFCMNAACCSLVIGGVLINSLSDAMLAQSFLSIRLKQFKFVPFDIRF